MRSYVDRGRSWFNFCARMEEEINTEDAWDDTVSGYTFVPLVHICRIINSEVDRYLWDNL